MNKANYITFAITKTCNFRCPYCVVGGHGEAQFSDQVEMIPKLAMTVARAAVSVGLRRLRISGGEPCLHPRIIDIVDDFTRLSVDEVVLSTNGSAVQKILNWSQQSASQMQRRRLRVVVSIDSLHSKGFNYHAGRAGHFERCLKNIASLSRAGILKRINMVVTKHNISEIKTMAEFCSSLGVPLKLSDVGLRQNQLQSQGSIRANLEVVREELLKLGPVLQDPNDYSQAFGTPCDSFDVFGQRIKIKDSMNGARFNMGAVCEKCKFFPCSEGLYFVTVLPDGGLSGCQSNGFSRYISRETIHALQHRPLTEEEFFGLKSLLLEMYAVIESAEMLVPTAK